MNRKCTLYPVDNNLWVKSRSGINHKVMLVEFSVENYRSFQEKQTLSMVAAEDETMLDSNTFSIPHTDDLRLVRGAVIYGPNASGKSTNNLKRSFGKKNPREYF